MRFTSGGLHENLGPHEQGGIRLPPVCYQMAPMSPIRHCMIERMTIRNLSPATQRSCVSAVSKFCRYFGRSPDLLDLEDALTFHVHLASVAISWLALNQIVGALRFFYGVTLGGALLPERIAYAHAL